VILGKHPEACLKKFDIVSYHFCYFLLSGIWQWDVRDAYWNIWKDLFEFINVQNP
jgi:hypothetical protein